MHEKRYFDFLIVLHTTDFQTAFDVNTRFPFLSTAECPFARHSADINHGKSTPGHPYFSHS